MTYNTVSVSGNNIFGNASGEVVNVTLSPTAFFFDTANNIEINPPVISVTSNNAGAWTLSGIIDPTVAGTGMAWKLVVQDKLSNAVLYSATVQIAFANGASQQWLSLAPPPAPSSATNYLVATGAPTAANQFLQSTGANSNVLQYQYGTAPINVLNFQADPTGAADSTTAINNAIAAATGNAAPATHSRVPTQAVYLPTGSYKITADLLIQSVLGFDFHGDGPELTVLVASGSGWTTSPLVIDGSYRGRFSGFTLKGDGTEQCTNAITYTWTTNAQRSSTGNAFHDINIRSLNYVNGFSLAGSGTRQLDGTELHNIVVSGGQTPGSWLNTGNWQQGFTFGSGSFGNNYDHAAFRCDSSGHYYGMYVNASSLALYGSQPANNAFDFYINPGAQTTISNVQSQQCGQFITSPSNFAAIPVTVSDVQIKTTIGNGAGSAIMTLLGGTWNFNNISAANYQVAGSGVYSLATIVMTGSSSSRPCVATFTGLALDGVRTSAFTLTNAIAVVQNYSNYNPQTGNYTYAAGDASSFNQGGAWTTVGGVQVPQVNFQTSGSTYSVPAGAQTVFVACMGGGGGGGSGALATSGAAGGGGGGGGGGYSSATFQASQLSSPVSISVGAGGSGGAAVSSAGAGNIGVDGSSTTFGTYLWAHGGTKGQPGNATNAGAATGGPGGFGMFSGGAGGASVTTGAAGSNGTATGVTGGGGAGGGVIAGPTAENGGGCAAVTLGSSAGGTTGGTTVPVNPTFNAAPAQGDGAAGGGGGAAVTSGTAQSGATATGNCGAGGGGGGACSAASGGQSGAGGSGSGGFILCIAYFQ